MRGLHATLAIEAGASPDVVARSLGHRSASMTLSAYVAPGSAKAATATRVQNLSLAPLPRPSSFYRCCTHVAQPKPTSPLKTPSVVTDGV